MKNIRIDRRTARAVASRKKILASAKELFITEGFKKTTIALISKHAGIGYGTAYNHFPNGKDDIFLEIMEEVMDEFYGIANNEYTVNSKEEAHAFILSNVNNLFELADKHQKVLQVLHESLWISEVIHYKWEDISKRFIKRIAWNVEQAIEKKLARNPNYDPEVVASVLFYTIEHNLWNIILDKVEKDHLLIAQNIAEVYTNGLYK